MSSVILKHNHLLGIEQLTCISYINLFLSYLINSHSKSALWIWVGYNHLVSIFSLFLILSRRHSYHIWRASYDIITIIPWVLVGYELAIIISYPTSASGIIVLLKTPTKHLPDFICKNNRFSACFKFRADATVTIFGEHSIMAHIPWWPSQSEL